MTPKLSLRRIDAARLRRRARAVRERDGGAFWLSEADRDRRERLAALMDARAAELDALAASEEDTEDVLRAARFLGVIL